MIHYSDKQYNQQQRRRQNGQYRRVDRCSVAGCETPCPDGFYWNNGRGICEKCVDKYGAEGFGTQTLPPNGFDPL